MKATITTKYGNSKVLIFKEVSRPEPKNDEILVKVHSKTVNRTDIANITAKPIIMRTFLGLIKPKRKIQGTDFAGEVIKIGKGVKNFKVKDKVFGFDDQVLCSNAEYLVISEKKAVVKMPLKTSFKDAAVSIEGVHYAYNFLNKVSLKKGDRVLVNGGSGAIGSAIIQISKYFGAKEVIATCRGKDSIKVKSIGADKTIDYTKEDFTQIEGKFDFVFDSVGKSSFSKCRGILKKKGVYISSELGFMAQNVYLQLFTKRTKFPIPVKPKDSLIFIKDLVENGKFKPVIDREYKFKDIRKAYDYVASGEKVGNVIISFD